MTTANVERPGCDGRGPTLLIPKIKAFAGRRAERRRVDRNRPDDGPSRGRCARGTDHRVDVVAIALHGGLPRSRRSGDKPATFQYRWSSPDMPRWSPST